jgi:hypothetical protein
MFYVKHLKASGLAIGRGHEEIEDAEQEADGFRMLGYTEVEVLVSLATADENTTAAVAAADEGDEIAKKAAAFTRPPRIPVLGKAGYGNWDAPKLAPATTGA